MHGPGACESLVEFSFVSAISPNLPPAALLRLARQSRSFNARMGLTGRLELVASRFELLVEGDCGTVLRLAARILADPRHTSIRITALGAIAARRFSDWAAAGFEPGDGAHAVRPIGRNVYRFAPTSGRAAGECAASGVFGEAG